jgi:hypothetical protein
VGSQPGSVGGVSIDLGACFRDFYESAVRVETLPAYAVGGEEAERYAAWLHGDAMPPRSLRDSDYLQMLARDALTPGGRTWERVRILDEPLSDYAQFEVDAYSANEAVGEQICIAVRAGGSPAARTDLAGMCRDFWLFDRGCPAEEFAALMHYDEHGAFLGASVAGEDELRQCRSALSVAMLHAVTLSAYLAGRRAQAAA